MSAINLPSPATQPHLPHGLPSPSASMRTHPSNQYLPAHGSRIRATFSNTDVRNLDFQRSQHNEETPPRPSSISNPPSASNGTYWGEGVSRSREPRIFPGIMHERQRRNSLRQGSASENDMEASTGNLAGLSRLAVTEEKGGEGSSEDTQ